MARELTDGVWLFDLGFVTPFRSNAYLIDESAMSDVDGDDLTLCDVGLWRNRPSIRSEFDALGYGFKDLDRILLTHYDLDHVSGLGRILDDFDGPVYLGAGDVDLLNGADLPDPLHHKGMFHRVARRLFPLPAAADVHRVTDGDRIGKFTAYATPGHNHGHTVYAHDASVAILGDLVWEERGLLTTPFWLDSYDMRELRESVETLADRMDPFEVAAMGHGDPIVGGGYDALRALVERL